MNQNRHTLQTIRQLLLHPGCLSLIIIYAAIILLGAAMTLIALYVPQDWQTVFTLLAALGCIAAAAWLTLRNVVPEKPRAGQQVALSMDALPGSYHMSVRQVLLPDGPVTPGPMTPGSSMLLCMSAAALCQREPGPVDQAMSRCLQRMGVKTDLLRKGMPRMDILTVDGLTWQIHRDGSRLRAFACGTPQQVLSLCGSMLGRNTRPMNRGLRAELLSLSAAEAIPPLCFATAPWNGQTLGEPVYLGTFLLQEEAEPEAAEEIDLLRSLALDPFLHDPAQPEEADRMNKLLGLTPGDPQQTYCFRPAQPCRLSQEIRRRQQDRHGVLMFALQAATILQILGAVLLIAGMPFTSLCTTAAILLVCMSYIVPRREVQARRIRRADILQLVFSCLVAAACAFLAWRIVRHMGYSGSTARSTVRLTLMPFLFRCMHAVLTRYGAARRLRLGFPCGICLAMVIMDLWLGVPILSILFSLALGSFTALAGYLLCRIHPRSKR